MKLFRQICCSLVPLVGFIKFVFKIKVTLLLSFALFSRRSCLLYGDIANQKVTEFHTYTVEEWDGYLKVRRINLRDARSVKYT